jgi:hypothetical protein
MAVERNDFTEALKKEGYKWYWSAYDEIPTTYQSLFAEEDIDAAYTKETSAVGLNDLVEKPESEPIKTDAPHEGYPIIGKVRTFASKVVWSMELYDDAQVANLFQKTVQSWGDAVPRTKDRWYSGFFNYGAYTAGHAIFNNTIPDVVIDTSGNLCYDGKPFFTATGNERSSIAGGTYYNASASLDLDATNLQTVYAHMTQTNNRDEKDDEIILEPDTLLVPPALKFKAEELLQYNNQFTTGFLLNVTKPANFLKGKINVVVWPRLTDTDCWILGCAKKGIVALNRMSEQIDFYRDNETKAYVATIVVRFGGYVRNWRYWYGCNLPTS